ncbi:MAG: hypothetical protein JWN08_1622 [Frankiales bacterium]|jgi:hypothetical protein|nr:hypothetical protein [Frankiales bacterium]
MTKRCVTCHVTQPLSAFNRRASSADGLQARCRDCARAWYVANRVEHLQNTGRRSAEVRRRYQALIGSYLLEHPCVDCGETDVRCLEFDHEEPSLKSAAVHRLVASGVAWQRILDEIAKCSVRCSNCHQRRTMRMQGSWRQAFHEAQAWTGAAERLAVVLAPRP